MWDPLLNEFPESVHGFRCMLAIKYLQALEETYEPNTLGHDLVRDLICVIRARDYVEATRRYNHFHSRLEVRRSCTSTARSAAVLLSPLSKAYQQATIMDVPAHVSKAQNVQNVQKS
ncbi:AV2 [East African cassava mosaic Malawi virus]|uniref:Protein V2 n=1 Tax=East African cassava mosaic Malawi virus TaxID=223264 RepID=U5KI90_9GEMI|nr:AV2 [East African cassava mosaic Malawi virus]AGR84124.1 AV2 [East African cassava mosaic Malawi virus]